MNLIFNNKCFYFFNNKCFYSYFIQVNDPAFGEPF